jgi:hypothetical protein
MRNDDYERFTQILTGVFEVYGKDRSDTAIALWWKVLEPYSLADVEQALSDHLRSVRFAPTPADVVTSLSARDGRPSADVAWSLVPHDEHESSCWTDEIAKAYGAAAPLLKHGDKIAARRAFIDAYEFEVAAARRSGKPVNAWFSWGFDASGRASAVARALELGMIQPERAAKFALQLPNYSTELPRLAGVLKRLQ